MNDFKDLTIQQLKKLVKLYNLHTVIKGYSKMKKKELINNLEKHTMLDNKRLIQLPDFHTIDVDASNIINETEKRKQEREKRKQKRAKERRNLKQTKQETPKKQEAPKSNIEEAINKMDELIEQRRRAIENYKKNPKENIEKYTVFDSKGKENKKFKDLKIKVEEKEFIFPKVGLFNNPEDMDEHSGMGWRYSYGYSDSAADVKNKQVINDKINYPNKFNLMSDHTLKQNHHIISSINDNPIHMAHIDSRDNTKKLYIAFVDVHPDFQGKGLAEKAFLLLWAYMKKYDLLKDIKSVNLTYAANAPVVGTYIRMINAAGFHNPQSDELDFKNMTKAFKTYLHLIKTEFDFTFYKKNSNEYKELKEDKIRMVYFTYLQKLNELFNKIEKGGKIDTIQESILFIICTSYEKFHEFGIYNNALTSEDLRSINAGYKMLLDKPNIDNTIPELGIKVIKESYNFLKKNL